jgi:hypothetical protein
MKRVVLPPAASNAPAPVLTQPDEASGRLLAWIRPHDSKADGAAFIDSYVAEGWNVLEAGAAVADNEVAARSIVDAVKQADSYVSFTSIMFIADHGAASAVCQAILQAHRKDLLKGPCGLVTIDAFAERAVPALGDKLAELENLATIWAVHRTHSALRKRTFARHTALQTRGQETHFLVLPNAARSMAERLADTRDPLSREIRWLLEPIHSRSA